MKLTSTLKIAAATASVIGILLGFFERWFSPTVLVTEDSPSYPEWLGASSFSKSLANVEQKRV